ncbi:MAG: GTP pyrophosphokinase family protein [Lachnospiraceae bacterium]|nr:GTP pyrophosphokinase family protein [Lachnospiraceae bacterium]MCR4803833.1 GTP pyrophosphokinase family protein [Lachnospiraceae bacterium]
MNKEDYLFYGAYAPILEIAENTVLEQIDAILKKNVNEGVHNPAEYIISRVKSADSMKEKLVRKGMDTDVLSAIKQMNDTVGIRIVTHFIGDVYTISDYLKQSDAWTIEEIKDYISNPKPNGYRSLHIILKMPLHGSELDFLPVEIQIRTIAMDCWASLEHQLKYKKNIPNADLIATELKRCSDEIASTDLSMQTIREMLAK